MSTQQYQPSKRLSLTLLVLLTGLAAWVRVTGITQSLWLDEAATWLQVRGSFLSMLSSTMGDNYPPLYNTVAWVFVQILGDAEWVLRLPAAVFGIALVPMLYLLGARVGGRTAGLLGALLIALSGFHVYFSVEARTYSLLALAACAYAWAVLRDSERPTRASGWTVSAIGLALLLSHPYGALSWLAVAGAALALSNQRLRLQRILAITIVFFLPFGIALLVHAYSITRSGFWIPEPDPSYVLTQLNRLTSWLLPALLLCAAAAFLPPRNVPRSPALLILLSLAVVPAALGYLASITTRPVFLDRYLIGSLPAVVVLASIGVTRWLTDGRIVLAVAGFTTVAGSLSLVHGSPPLRQDWRGVAAYVTSRIGPDDCVMLLPNYEELSWSYYDRSDTCHAASLDEALIRAPRGHLFVAADPRAASVDILETYKLRPLLDTRPFHRLSLYEFGPPVTPVH